MAKWDGTWYGKALMTLRSEGSSDTVDMASLTKDIDIGGLEKTIEQIALANGGYIPKVNPTSNVEVTFSNVYLLGSEKILEYFLGGSDTGEYYVTDDRVKVRLAMLWTEDTAVTSAEDATTAGQKALRIVINDMNIDYARPKTEDRNMVWEMKLTALPLDRTGNSNFKVQYPPDDTTGLSALPSY